MGLNLEKLEKVREVGNGLTQARCPACAEARKDAKGEHLRIYPDGRYGCCVFPKDKEHRRRIFALAGGKLAGPRPMRVRVASGGPTATPARSISESLKGFLGTLGTGETESKTSGAKSGTLGTPKSESVSTVPSAADWPELNLGTLGTGISKSRAYARVSTHTYKDWETGVPSVPRGQDGLEPPELLLKRVVSEPRAAKQPSEASAAEGPLPYLTPGGTLVIPFDSPERYHWWKPDGERLHVWETRAEVLRRMEEGTGKDEHGTGV